MLELAIDQCRVFRIVELKCLQCAVCQILHGQAVITGDHQGQAVTHRRGLLEVLDHVTTAVGSGQIGAALEIVVADMHVVGCQQVTQVNHARAGVRCILTVREAVDQLGEIVERVAGGTRITTGHVQRQEAFDNTLVAGKGSQATNVIGVVDVLVGGVQADETVG